MKILTMPQRSIEWFAAKEGKVSGTTLGAALSQTKAKSHSTLKRGHLDEIAESHNIDPSPFKTIKALGLALDETIGPLEPANLGAAAETLVNKLIAELTSERDSGVKTKAMDKGVGLEPFALDAYTKETGIEIEEVGLLVSDLDGFVVSPDGISKDGGVEIKCPDSKTHIKYIRTGLPNEYWHQVHAPFLLSKRFEYWDFVSYDPSNYIKPLYIQRIERPDEQWIEDTNKILSEFISHLNREYERIAF